MQLTQPPLRRRRRYIVAAMAVLAIAASAVSWAPAMADRNGKQTLRLVAHQTHYDFLDLGAAGYSLGDQLAFGETFSKRGDSVGRSGVACTVTAFEAPPSDVVTVNCVGTLKLKDGQVNLQGLLELDGLDDPGPFRVAITGGTGRYRGAGGEAVAWQPNPPENRYIYELRLDAEALRR
jgi:hypothetical protein